MLTREDRQKIIDWIAGDGHAKGLLEDGDLSVEATRTEIDEFITQCHDTLTHRMQTPPPYVFYTGVHPCSFRSGEPAIIVGVEWVTPTGRGGKPLPGRACFRIQFQDGREDVTPICDAGNYTLDGTPRWTGR